MCVQIAAYIMQTYGRIYHNADLLEKLIADINVLNDFRNPIC